MKYEIFNDRDSKYIRYDRDNVVDIRIILFRNPEEDLEAATKEYLDNKILNLDAGSFTGILKHANIPLFVGKDIVTPNEKTLELRKIHKGLPLSPVVEVDSFGRVIKNHKLKDSDIDDSVSISFEKITDKPTTLDEFKITDLVRNNHPDSILSDTVVNDYKGKITKSPMPIEYLEIKFEEIKRKQLPVGSQLIIMDGGDTTSRTILSNGATIQAKQFPDLVLALTGDPKATSAKLVDCTKDDQARFYRTGIPAKTYVVF